MLDPGRLKREAEELLARPFGRSAEELGALLTDCAAVALHIRAAILGREGDGGEIESLSASSARISKLMDEIRQRLDEVRPRA
jgi:hypothetical protein